MMQSNPKPRILQVVTHLALGGAERVCFTLMRELRDRFDFGLLAVRGVEESDVGRAFHDELRELHIPLFTATKVSIKHGGMAVAGLAMARACRAFQPDLIHLHTEIPESTYSAMTMLPTKWKRVPLVRTIHNTVLWTPWRRMGRWCERRMTASHVAAVSSAALDAYNGFRAEANPNPLPSAPLIIHNGVRASTLLRRDVAGTGPIRIIFAGRLEAQKSADLIPQIVRQTRVPNEARVVLDLFGDGTFHDELAALAASPPVGWTIRLASAVANLRERFVEYDFAVMPSRYEGFGLVAVEALLEGLPVVSTTAAGLREVFPTDYPWLTEPGNAASFAATLSNALTTSAEERARITATATRFALDHFSVQAMGNAYAVLFDRVLKSTST